MMDQLTLGIGAIGSLAMVVAAVLDRQRLAIAIGLGFLFVAPVDLTSFSGVSVSGVAHSQPEISTFVVTTLVFAFMAMRFRDRQRLPLPLVLFVLYIGVGMVFWWSASPLEFSGVAQYLLAPAGWLAGTFLANFARQSSAHARFLVLALLAAIAIQSGVALLQISGVDFHRLSADAQLFLGWRVRGTWNHPNTLGEAAFIALLIFLPFSRHASSFIARSSLVGIVLCFLLFSLSGGRANFIAGLAVVLLWVVLVPRAGTGTSRKVYLTVVAVFSVVAFVTLSGRFQEDPTGGSRLSLVDGALSVLPRFFWQGMGPNDYLTVIRRIDPKLAASGLPVHNSFLLVLIELGVVGAVLLFLPWVLTFVRGCNGLFRRRLNLDYYRITVCAFLPVGLIAMTDKALVSGGVLPLWLLAVGMCAQGAANDERPADPPEVLLPGPMQHLERWFAGADWSARFRR